MKISTKKLLAISSILFFFALSVQAGPLRQDSNGVASKMNTGAGSASFDIINAGGSSDLSSMIKKVIDIFLGFIGILLTVYILMAGYKWITANGDEKKVTEAKTSIQHAVVGLVIILAAYSLTYFVFQSVGSVAEDGGAAGAVTPK